MAPPLTVLSVDVGETNIGVCLWDSEEGIVDWRRVPLPAPELYYGERVRLFFVRNPRFKNAEMLVIEAQPNIGSTTMHIIEACFYMMWPTSFAIRVNPHHVKAFFGHAMSKRNYTHARSKENAVCLVRRLVAERYIVGDLATTFSTEAKKDDLADSLLQLMYFVCVSYERVAPHKVPLGAAMMKRVRNAMISWGDTPMVDAPPLT
jgi:hypothetical protein